MSSTETVGVVVADEQNSTHSYAEWGAIFAGAFVATAISLILFAFGGGIGMSISSPYPGAGVSLESLSYLTMAWVLAVMIFSFIAGGYVAGRLRRPAPNATDDAVDFRDGAHGLIVWATGILIGAALSAHIAGAATGAAFDRGVSAAAYEAGVVMRGGETIDAEDRNMLASVLVNTGADGELSDSDRAFASEIVADATGLDEAEARARIDEWETTSREAADRARKVGAIAAFLMGASALVAAAGAYFAACMGGRHRDANSPFPWTRARAKR